MPASTELFSTAGASPFGRRQRRARGARIPVTVVTGFLGSGKTTLIRELLRRPEGANTAVVINEFGEVGIDDALLRTSSDATVLLGNGCLCCTVRTDLQESLRALFADRARGAVPGFERVVIETSGLADPGPVLQTFASDRALGEEFHLQSLVTVLDASRRGRNLDRMPEARHQVALADRIVLSKTDTADAGGSKSLPRASRIKRGAGHGRIARRDRPRLSARRSARSGGAARRTSSRPRARPFARDREFSAVLRRTAALEGVRAGHGRADRAARAGLAARQGSRRGHGLQGAGRRPCRAACRAPADRAGGLARRRPPFAARLYYARLAARSGRAAVPRRPHRRFCWERGRPPA